MNPDELADRLERAARDLGPAIHRQVQRAAAIGMGRIKANASGRPGPNVITGDYRGSWRVESRALANGGQATIGTNRPQGRRLEFGFFGTDSLGRRYQQPPFPHVQPALPHIQSALLSGMRDAVEEVLS